MQKVVIDQPYVPVLPHRGRIWPALLAWYGPRLLRKRYGVTKVECVHAERLKESLRAGWGVVLTPNHCREEDPLVLGALTRAAGSPFYAMASWHVFKQGRLSAFFLPRAGAFSIYREGIDRGAINTAIAMVETAERPLVVFPEGFLSRANDRLNPLLEGVSLIARTAAKKRAKLSPPGRVFVHPLALRYRFGGDLAPTVAGVLDCIEPRLTWPPARQLPIRARVARIGEALLSLKRSSASAMPKPEPSAPASPRSSSLCCTPSMTNGSSPARPTTSTPEYSASASRSSPIW